VPEEIAPFTEDPKEFVETVVKKSGVRIHDSGYGYPKNDYHCELWFLILAALCDQELRPLQAKFRWARTSRRYLNPAVIDALLLPYRKTTVIGAYEYWAAGLHSTSVNVGPKRSNIVGP
jgi:hypothetical protein